ncbi:MULTISPECIES: urease subunit beta [Streptomyces]|uniref:urease subunit beta n=1 Tax=Streptomyces TaxID=1883 RepID=UPI0002E1E739|nr:MULTISPECIES: urease subunit beta [Streptomyces]MCX4508115.1 urease subunit beta [Streptomyces anulatus]MCX4523423.1 urease subunit beta [Streptomyces anulatus]MCX4606433.1 urease subunit beta [Streptomyces anulatus]WSI82405.1 urease subunit beta [Streptomyces anulatus]WSU78379.1 urease subunit beta [Streptomyces anulatus]
MIPGEIRTGSGVLHINAESAVLALTVVNDGDRPIQVGSHLHFSDANPALSFDRAAARGFRLDIPSGTSLRFEPGVGVDVSLVELRGRRRVPGIVLPGTRTSAPAAPTPRTEDLVTWPS